MNTSITGVSSMHICILMKWNISQWLNLIPCDCTANSRVNIDIMMQICGQEIIKAGRNQCCPAAKTLSRQLNCITIFLPSIFCNTCRQDGFWWVNSCCTTVTSYECHSTWIDWQLHCLLNRLFGQTTKKNQNYALPALSEGNSSAISRFPHKVPVMRAELFYC